MKNSPVKIWRNQPKIRSLLGIEGTVISYTRIAIPPQSFMSQAPYIVVVVKTKQGMLTGQLVDCVLSECTFGMKVHAVLRRTSDPHTEDIIPYGVKFRPITE